MQSCMETRIYHGQITASDLATALSTRFNRGNLMAQKARSGSQSVVQIATRQGQQSGGITAIGITIQDHEDGVTVKLGKQAWFGIAASLGATLLAFRQNPFNLIGRLDDLAQDIENIKLSEQIWNAIDEIAATYGATKELSERFKRTGCNYCGTANPVGTPRCLACGAPLGDVQPETCKDCGFILRGDEANCPNCGTKTRAT